MTDTPPGRFPFTTTGETTRDLPAADAPFHLATGLSSTPSE